MDRQINTDKNGERWSESAIKRVWMVGWMIPGKNPDLWRMDKYAEIIKFTDFGDRSSKYGWEIDHIIPVSFGGGDQIVNLQPLNWMNNEKKGETLNWRHHV